jgi:hypothetical protein
MRGRWTAQEPSLKQASGAPTGDKAKKYVERLDQRMGRRKDKQEILRTSSK